MLIRVVLIALLAAPLSVFAQAGDIAADPDRMEQRILALGKFGTNEEGGVSRVPTAMQTSRAGITLKA